MEPPRPEISWIVLSYQDAPALPGLLRGLHAALAASGRTFELLLADDGSTDGSADAAEALCTELPELRVIRSDRNTGVGANFRRGYEAARGEVIGYVDGDAQYFADDVPRLLDALGDAGAVSGVRVERADPWSRLVVSRGWAFVLRALFGLRVGDVNSGIKLYRREFLDRATPLVSDGPFYDAEILIRGTRDGTGGDAGPEQRIVDLPVEHRPRPHGRNRGASLATIRRAAAEALGDAFRPYRRRGARAWCVACALAVLAIGERAGRSRSP